MMDNLPPANPAESNRRPEDAELQQILSRSAILTGIAGFIPVPFLDDYAAERVRQHMVVSLLKRQGLSHANYLRPLYRESISCIGSVFQFVRSLIVKPVRKLFRTLFFFLAIRSVTLQMARVYLLGRAIDLCLQNNSIQSEKDVLRFSPAFAKTFEGTDRKFFTHLLEQTGRGLAPFQKGAREVMRRIFREKRKAEEKGAPDSQQFAKLTDEEQARLDAEAERLAETLKQEEVAGFLARFDAKFLNNFRQSSATD